MIVKLAYSWDWCVTVQRHKQGVTSKGLNKRVRGFWNFDFIELLLSLSFQISSIRVHLLLFPTYSFFSFLSGNWRPIPCSSEGVNQVWVSSAGRSRVQSSRSSVGSFASFETSGIWAAVRMPWMYRGPKHGVNSCWNLNTNKTYQWWSTRNSAIVEVTDRSQLYTMSV